MRRLLIYLILIGAISCNSTEDPPNTDDSSSDSDSDSDNDTDGDSDSDSDTIPFYADAIAVEVTGEENDYTFSVTVESPDTGCDLYADWWEVLSPTGDLIFRRILNHSHVDEQPFTRDGGPVEVSATDGLIIRAHMFPTGYGGKSLQGTVESGFLESPDLSDDFAPDVESQDPQPEDCLY